jgi:hypothetical protein
MPLTLKEQHEGRNAIQCLKALSIRIQNDIDYDDFKGLQYQIKRLMEIFEVKYGIKSETEICKSLD